MSQVMTTDAYNVSGEKIYSRAKEVYKYTRQVYGAKSSQTDSNHVWFKQTIRRKTTKILLKKSS